MVRKLLHTLLFALVSLPIALSAQRLSQQAEISLMTCGPGADLYSIFGHCAIHVNDPELKIDKIYNYGTFNFGEPGFYIKFTRGKLNYYLSTENYNGFIRSYQYEKRTVKRQVLNLTPAEKQEFFSFLENNALPENRAYLYDFFYDNCATRLRDITEKTLGPKLKFDYQFVEEAGNKTFRQLLDPYLESQPWSDFGIDLGLGSVTDKTAPGRDYMFLPDYLFEAFQDGKIERDGALVPLVKETQTIYQAPESALPIPPWYQGPIFVCWMIFLVLFLLTWLEIRMGKKFYWLDFILLFVYGLIGWVVLLLWIATDHTATAMNLNVIWLMPLHLFAAFFLIPKKKKTWLRNYFVVTGVLDLGLLIGWIFIPQQFHAAYFPLILIMMIRLALFPGKFRQGS